MGWDEQKGEGPTPSAPLLTLWQWKGKPGSACQPGRFGAPASPPTGLHRLAPPYRNPCSGHGDRSGNT